MSDNQLKSFEEIEAQRAYDELVAYRIERIKEMLDETYHEGYADSLTTQEWQFYYEAYKDVF